MIVMKFGGTSVGDAERIRAVAGIVKARLDRKPVVVVSAHSGVTDELIEAAEGATRELPRLEAIRKRHVEILAGLGLPESLIGENLKELADLLHGIHLVRELTPRTLDYVVSFGERMAAKTVAAHFRKAGMDAVAADAYDVGLLTDSRFMNANPLPGIDGEIAGKLSRMIECGKVPVVTGFIAKDVDGDITTLGRGGSDYTATILGRALDAEEVQVWKDVDGVMTADPRILPGARTVEHLSFAEASELAYYGAEVLHPSTMKPAMEKDIPVRVLNTYRPQAPGTVITAAPTPGERAVKSIAYRSNQVLINIVSTRMLLTHGFMAKVFEIFAKYEIVIDMIATSEVTISMTTDGDEHLGEVAKDLADIAEIRWDTGKTLVCVVGSGMRHTIGTASSVFSAVSEAGVNIQMISQGASEINIAFLIDDKDVAMAVRSLHAKFFEGP